MHFKIKRIKALFTKRSDMFHKILSELKGFKKEEVVFEIVEGPLRILIREKAKKGKLGLKGIDNIEFRAGRYGNEPGKDLWIKLLYPENLRGEKINIEIKSSKKGVEEHKRKFDTPVVIVRDKDIKKQSSLIKIAKRLYNIIFERVREKTKELTTKS